MPILKFNAKSARIRWLSWLLLSTTSFAQNYTAERTSDRGVPIVRLTDAAHGVEVSILPSVGNTAYQMKVHGKNILYFPPGDVSEYLKSPRLGGIPFLAPWADLLDEQAFWANGKRYGFNMSLGNVRGSRPIHGLLISSPLWQVTEVVADALSAHVSSRLEFWRYPDLMAQWPFAHEYEMTYSLADGVLEVKTTITNLSTDPMPVVIGFHPFFQIPDIPRDEWVAHLSARVHVVADEHQIPTGEMRPLDIANPLPLRGQLWTTVLLTWRGMRTGARTSRSNRAARPWKPYLDPNSASPPFICRHPHPERPGSSSALSHWPLSSVESTWCARAGIPTCRRCPLMGSGPRVSGYGPVESDALSWSRRWSPIGAS